LEAQAPKSHTLRTATTHQTKKIAAIWKFFKDFRVIFAFSFDLIYFKNVSFSKIVEL
jgi:hypothetical protein